MSAGRLFTAATRHNVNKELNQSETQIQPSEPKRGITKITNSKKIKANIWSTE